MTRLYAHQGVKSYLLVGNDQGEEGHGLACPGRHFEDAVTLGVVPASNRLSRWCEVYSTYRRVQCALEVAHVRVLL